MMQNMGREKECRIKAREFLSGTAKQALIPSIKFIAQFNFYINFQTVALFEDEVSKRILINGCIGHINDALTDSGLLGHQHLDVDLDETAKSIKFNYNHDRHHFRVVLEKERFMISRQSSSMEQFVTWYFMLMPYASRIFSGIRDEIFRNTKQKVNPTYSGFMFSFYLTDFKFGATNGRNIDVIKSVLKQFPATGEKTSSDDTWKEFYRIDLKVSKREFVRSKLRNCWYNLEAPFNHGGRYIEAIFDLRSSDLEETDAQGEVIRTVGFDPEAIDEYTTALEDFLRDKAVESFLAGILNGWQFSTERTL